MAETQARPGARPAASPFRSAEEREQDRSQKRQALLRAAVRMFNERGFHQTSLDDVAASLGVTKPVIYHYLGNKDQVLFECVRIGLEQLQEAAARVRAQQGRGFDRLAAFLRAYAEVVMDDFGRCMIRTGEELLSPATGERFRQMKAEIDRILRTMLEEGAADGSIAVDDVRLTSFTLAGAINWTARWHREDGPLDPPVIAERMVGILSRGLAPR